MTAKRFGVSTSVVLFSFPPSTAGATRSIRLTPVDLQTKGRDREARRLHSITYTERPFTRNWTLRGPLALSSLAMLFVYARIFSFDALVIVTVGMDMMASPEWIPASWTCSIMAPITVLVPSETASTSTSLAPSRNWLTVTG